MDENTREIIRIIARKHLKIETLDTRNSDDLDFHDLSVWSIRDALAAAYKAGAINALSSNAQKTR